MSKVVPWWQDLSGGIVGGCAGIVIGHPLDTLKLRIQTGQFRHATAALTDALHHGGVCELFKGLTSPVVGNVPMQALIFGVYGQSLRWLEGGQVSDTPRLSSVIVAGQAAGMLQLLAMCPAEHCKVLLQQRCGLNKAAYKGSFDCARSIVRLHGVSGLYKGAFACFMRDVGSGSYGIYYGAYELTRQQMLRSVADNCDAHGQIHPVSTLAAGARCGLLSWTWCYPFDVIKSRV